MTHARTRLCLGLLAGAAVTLAGAGGASALDIVPHRAVYDLSLASAPGGSPVIGVDGQMFFEWGDSCDGWTVDQRYLMRFLYAEGPEVELTSTYSTWESKDGKEFSFNLRSETNGTVDEEMRGSASLDQPGPSGLATFRVPEDRTEPLPAGTLFPTAHTITLLGKAEQGVKLFNAMLFDGTEKEGRIEVSAAIGKPIPAPGPGADVDPLLNRPSWPVSMAFFPDAERDATPKYEMAARLYDNGVASEMLIDYGTFAVQATLSRIEALDHGC